jgi:8-oxo-dGTP diphosphatase
LNIENPRFISVAYEEFYGLEYMTLGILATARGEPINRQSESIKDWEWFPLDNLPRPLFAPASRIIRNYKKGVMCSKDQFYNRGRTV